jgi:hypothetical protein
MNNNSGIGWSRRHWLALAGSGVLGIKLYGAEADFWNQKDPSEWTSEEIATLLAKSPWAKEATPQSESTAQSVASGLARGGRRRTAGSAQSAVKGVVVWESAQAVLDARKKALPDEFANHYTLSVSGIALPSESETDLYDQLRQFTSLHPDDQPPVQPGVVQKIEGSANGVLLGFSKDVLQLSTVDKTIEFSTTIGKMAVKAKFETKYMLYKGQLAV